MHLCFLKRKCTQFLQFLLIVIPCVCYSQNVRSRDQGPGLLNYLSLGYRQKFNNYLWQFNFHNTQRYRRWKVTLDEQFHSSMLLLGTVNDKWKDDQNLKFNVEYLIHPQAIVQTQMSSLVFNDKQSGLNNNIRAHMGSVGLKYLPAINIAASASAGPKWDLRLNQYDSGINYNLEMIAQDIMVQDYHNNLQFKFDQDRFHVRRNHDLNVHYLMKREFSPGTSDSLNIFTSDRRMDNYLSSDGDIESLREKIKGVDNHLKYHVTAGIDLKFSSSLLYKNVQVSYSGLESQQKERRRNDQKISNDLAFLMKRKNVHSQVTLSYWSQQQRYDIQALDPKIPFSKRTAFITPDNKSNRLNLHAWVGIRLSCADSLYTYYSASRFQYDTPDTSNFDDRDELRMNSRIVYSHAFSPALRLEVQTGLNFYHMVYIFGERSADNNWNRILRLGPSIVFIPDERIRFHQAFEVLANYVDYDFENAAMQTKSFVFRKFAVNDSLQWLVSRRSALNLDYRLQLEENGQLYWDRWSERVLLTRQNHWFHFTWKYAWQKHIYFSPGYTYFRRDEWRHNSDEFGVTMKEKTGTHLSHGPMLRFYYAPHAKLRIEFDGVRYRVHPIGQKKYYSNTIEVKWMWHF